MRISPIKNHQNQVSHKAVNQKFLKQARDNFKRYPFHHQGHLLTSLELKVAYGLLSYKDAIDTLDAIKPFCYDPNNLIDDLIESLKREISTR